MVRKPVPIFLPENLAYQKFITAFTAFIHAGYNFV
jgi:hypothetical protein